jgi:hypothetical protein
VLGVKVQERSVAALVLLLHLLVLEVRSRRHPAVDLRAERLDVLGHAERRLEFLHVFGRFIFGCEHAERDSDLRRVRWVDHGRVDFSCGLERCSGLGCQGDDFAAPAGLTQDLSISGSLVTGMGFGNRGTYAEDTKALDAWVLFLYGLYEFGDLGRRLGRCALGLEEVSQGLLLALIRRRVP